MKLTISPEYNSWKAEIQEILDKFGSEGETIKDKRNQLKLFKVNGKVINVKSFKIPIAINKIIYRYFLESKAERSFKNANYLLKHGIGTPAPIAFVEQSGALFGRSYYLSEQLPYDLTYRELIHEPDYPDNDKILRAFTRFTFRLHESSVYFLDHSPGNTLIQLNNGDYKFFLVDLNRMKFQNMDFTERMKNFHRITKFRHMAEVMANEYAKLVPQSEQEVFDTMWFYIQQFQQKAKRKQVLKQKLKIKK